MSFPDFLVLLCQRRFEEWDGVALNPIRVLFTDYDKDLSETIDSAGIFPKIKQGSMLSLRTTLLATESWKDDNRRASEKNAQVEF